MSSPKFIGARFFLSWFLLPWVVSAGRINTALLLLFYSEWEGGNKPASGAVKGETGWTLASAGLDACRSGSWNQELHRVSHGGGRGLGTWAIPCCLSRICIYRQLESERRWDLNPGTQMCPSPHLRVSPISSSSSHGLRSYIENFVNWFLCGIWGSLCVWVSDLPRMI